MSGDAQKLVVSMRTDGLGARLSAMMNALYFGERFGLPFRFSWPPMNVDGSFHGMARAEELFAPEFIATHHILGLIAGEFYEVGGTSMTASQAQAVLADPARRGFNIRTCDDAVILDGVSAPPADLERMWRRIALTPAMQAALDAGRAAAPPGAVAIHLRRGDTVYGEVRRKLHNPRFLPLGWVKAIIAAERAMGADIILVSDDARLLALLRERFEVLTAQSLGGGSMPAGTQRALFDVGLMSGCRTVVGSFSIYARMATIIGGIRMTSPRDLIAAEDRAGLVFRDLERHAADYTDLERAKELQFVANELSLDIGERMNLLAEAFRFDPENPTYAHQRASLLASLGRDDEADAALRDTIERGFVDAEGAIAQIVPRVNVLDRIGDDFERGASDGHHPYLTAVHAYRLSLAKRRDEALGFAERAHRLAPDSNPLLAAYVDHLMRARRYEEAKGLLLGALAAGRDWPQLHRQMRGTLLRLGDVEGALEHARAAHVGAPDDAAARVDYAWLLEQRKDRDEAVALVETLNLSASIDAPTLARYSMIMERAGRPRQAHEAAERALALRPGDRSYRRWFLKLGTMPQRAQKRPLTLVQRIRRKLRKFTGRIRGIIIPKR